LYYLPLTLTERLGYFKEEGLNVTITDFGGGAKALQSLIGGSADVVTGPMSTPSACRRRGRNRRGAGARPFPGIVLGVRKDKAASVKSIQGSEGLQDRVTAPGSSTNFFVNALIAREGLKADDVAIIASAPASAAVAAMKKGDIDAMSNLDPVMTSSSRMATLPCLPTRAPKKAT